MNTESYDHAGQKMFTPDEYVHIINQDKKVSEPTREETVYTMKGDEDYLNNGGYPCLDIAMDEAQQNDKAYAIKVCIDEKETYYAKLGTYGRLFNPVGLYSEGTSSQDLKHAGRPRWMLQEVDKKVFDFYVDFLRTKNPSYLHNAERET
jgi:hypothetical protein